MSCVTFLVCAELFQIISIFVTNNEGGKLMMNHKLLKGNASFLSHNVCLIKKKKRSIFFTDKI